MLPNISGLGRQKPEGVRGVGFGGLVLGFRSFDWMQRV